jgi:hypothetical protein
MTNIDVCVFGGTAAGVIAAVTAAQQGKRCVLVNPGLHVGGMTSGGLGATDVGNPAVVGGLAREFYRRVGRVYGLDDVAWRFEPHVAEQVLLDWIAEAGVTVISERLLNRVEKVGLRLQSLWTSQGETIEARVYIDASYEGDLLAAAGVGWTTERESVAQYGESLNGVRAASPAHQFRVRVDPYLRPGDPHSGLLPGVQDDEGRQPGEASQRLQAYNFRLCLTRDPNNRVPITAPAAYAPQRYELLARYFEALADAGQPLQFSDLFLIVRLPNGKADFNNNGAVSTDHIGGNWAYPEADPTRRAAIRQEHVDYTRGLFHFLATDTRVPAAIQQEAREWGLCRDEFMDSGGWPHQFYVREARRMLGAYVMTQADCEGTRAIADSIAMGSYTLDSHHCQRIVREGAAHNEGDVQVSVKPYPIAYRAITPKPEECPNLLVPVCLSASHAAHGSIRMEPVFMALGQTAGLAACHSLDERVEVQGIDLARLQVGLKATGQVLEYQPTLAAGEADGWLHADHVYREV